MDKHLPQRLLLGCLVLVMAGVLLFVLVAKPPWATRPPVTDNTAMDEPVLTLSSIAPEIVAPTDTPAVADPATRAFRGRPCPSLW